MIGDFAKWAKQEDFRDWFENQLGTEIWTPLYIPGLMSSTPNSEDKFIYSFLIQQDQVQSTLANPGFDQFDGYPGMEIEQNDKGEDEFRYYRYGSSYQEPIIFRRDFVSKPRYVELSQEFIHFHRLYEDKNNGQFILEHDDSSEEVVVKIEDNEWYVRTLRLKQYLAFTDKVLVVGVSNQRFFNKPIPNSNQATNTKPLHESSTSEWIYRLWYQQGFGDALFFSETLGKKIIRGIPLENTDIYPFEKPKQYETFIISLHEDGKPNEHTCDPEKLANYFGKNPGSPHYLTPVFFSKEVLKKYFSDPEKYEVQDGSIRIGGYILRADTNHPKYVVVFLGDLGRDISNREQKYWKSFNIMPEGKLSNTAFERSFLGKFTDPEAPEFVFVNAYEKLRSKWGKKFGWDLLKPLNKEDKYRISGLHIPLSENQQEFDSMIENLTIIMIDSLNSEQFNEILNKKGKLDKESKKLQSIKKLETICQEYGLKGYESHISFLHELYAMRSRSASHRKGSDEFREVVNYFDIENKGLIKVSGEIMDKAIKVLDYFSEQTDKAIQL